jgi:hypothetical protein
MNYGSDNCLVREYCLDWDFDETIIKDTRTNILAPFQNKGCKIVTDNVKIATFDIKLIE